MVVETGSEKANMTILHVFFCWSLYLKHLFAFVLAKVYTITAIHISSIYPL